MDPLTYQEKRQHFFSHIEDFWANLYGDEYALYDVFETDWDFIKKIRRASGRIGHIFFKTAKLLRQVDNEILLELGFPKETLAFLRLHPVSAESVIARLDLVASGDTIKCLELNSDTPTFIKEVFKINGLICREFQLVNPNEHVEEQLSDAVHNSIKSFVRESRPNIVFTSHHDHVEDLNTILYLQKLSRYPSQYIPLHSLSIVKDEGLFDQNGKRISILYRQTFPIENVITDRDTNGNPIGVWLLELVEAGRLALINPPSAFLLQNKAVQAVIWGLHEERNPFFTETEHEWIEEYFLPTFLEPERFLQNGQAFVKKPTFGREGDTVEIYDEKGMLKLADSHQSYMEYAQVYQQYIELPKVSFWSEKGKCEGRMIIGSFLINGEPSGLGLRVGNPITDNLSYFLPIGVKP